MIWLELAARSLALPYNQHFPNVIPGPKEFARSEVAEEIFYMAIVEDALQLKPFAGRRTYRARRTTARIAAQRDALHLQRVWADDVEAIAGRIRPGVLRVEEGEQHPSRLQH